MGFAESASRTRLARAAWGRLTSALPCLIAASITLTLVAACSGHRIPPTPPGMVFRVEAREVVSLFCRFEVFPVNREGPAVAIFDPGTRKVPSRLRIYRYPDGRLIEEGTSAIDVAAESSRASNPAGSFFDIDADGTADVIEVGRRPSREYGLVRVLSGRSKEVLFENRDPLEYETADRAIPLGDMDGDGYSELALLHPRMDRSTYDFQLWDKLFGAKSWVTIISGSRLAR